MNKLRLAVIGKDVSKSISPEIHSFIAKREGHNIKYEKLSIPEAQFEDNIDEIFAAFDGFNVTIPYKLSIIPHLEKLKGDAEIFGAVNTVLSKSREGYNTDGLGFCMMLENNGVEVENKSVLLLGAGGAGRSVAKKLIDGGAKLSVYDRAEDSAKKLEKEFSKISALDKIEIKPYDIIVNATGVGMHKTEGLINVCGAAVDLIYTPKTSKFLEIARSLGKKTINGEGMLFYQAYFSECIYFGTRPDACTAKKYFEEFSKENI